MDASEYPTLQYGSHEEILDHYKGSLELEALRKFAAENLALQCSILHQEWCTGEQMELIKRIKAMNSDELSNIIDEMNDAVEAKYFEAEQKVKSARKLVMAAERELEYAQASGDDSREE
eukprot:CAMPEP_0113328184 /NCGR_PEP_ID=MMETSP0010_2-20120614/19840_1 /TAXON_ID=216773 ORGANISM="Corethron hystrix, Strain 308" /NCGR_SAMPLE_ID=MMETSP0010_2 /ASSEMBLY_ACC=CAM_ASM_000155 /LENGTH=118 /DNA_ID=CAMNT_0000189407 /DNA_START=483 /DNA_END=836 /DNA_ORIENTATION=+ /assembly_acc=CAM_ASM_000155